MISRSTRSRRSERRRRLEERRKRTSRRHLNYRRNSNKKKRRGRRDSKRNDLRLRPRLLSKRKAETTTTPMSLSRAVSLLLEPAVSCTRGAPQLTR